MSNVNKSFLLVKPDAYEHLGKIVTMIEEYNFIIANVRMIRFANTQDVSSIIGSVTQSREEIEHVCSDLVVGFELVRDNAVDALNELVGHETPVRAKQLNPKSIRAKFGRDQIRNAVYCSPDNGIAIQNIQRFFDTPRAQTALYTNCSCLLIKPHILKSRQSGKILDRVLEAGFEISAMQLFHMERA